MKRFKGYEMGKRILQEETRMAMLEKMVVVLKAFVEAKDIE